MKKYCVQHAIQKIGQKVVNMNKLETNKQRSKLKYLCFKNCHKTIY